MVTGSIPVRDDIFAEFIFARTRFWRRCENDLFKGNLDCFIFNHALKFVLKQAFVSKVFLYCGNS